MNHAFANHRIATTPGQTLGRAMLGCALSALLAVGATGAIAVDAYPPKLVRLIVPFPSAGGTDMLREEGSEPRGGSAKDLGAFIQSENSRWGDIVRQSGARVE